MVGIVRHKHIGAGGQLLLLLLPLLVELWCWRRVQGRVSGRTAAGDCSGCIPEWHMWQQGRGEVVVLW